MLLLLRQAFPSSELPKNIWVSHSRTETSQICPDDVRGMWTLMWKYCISVRTIRQGDPLTPELKSVVLVCGWESIRAHAGSFPGVTLFNKIGHLQIRGGKLAFSFLNRLLQNELGCNMRLYGLPRVLKQTFNAVVCNKSSDDLRSKVVQLISCFFSLF